MTLWGNTFKEIMESEEVISNELSLREVKIKCMEFAAHNCSVGIYKPHEVMDIAILYFNWITKKETND